MEECGLFNFHFIVQMLLIDQCFIVYADLNYVFSSKNVNKLISFRTFILNDLFAFRTLENIFYKTILVQLISQL